MHRLCINPGHHMKLQYLGDSKDSFKWDYQDYLTHSLGFELLNILLMMTPDDNTNEGKTKPDWFPARNEIIQFCNNIRTKRNLSIIKSLPSKTGSAYQVNLHKPNIYITKNSRKLYYSEFDSEIDQVVFLDPDNGFEPEKSINEKHVSYNDISRILEQISDSDFVNIHYKHIKQLNEIYKQH